MRGFPISILTHICLPSLLLGQGATPPVATATVEVVAKRTLVEAAQYHQPELSQNAYHVENLHVKVGNLDVHLAKGVAGYLQTAGQSHGFYFKGEGTFTYLATDPLQHALTRYNLAENTKIVPTNSNGSLQVKDSINEAVVWMAGTPLPALESGSAEKSPKEAFEAALRFYSARETSLPPAFTTWANRMPLGQLMAYRQTNAPQSTVSTVEMEGTKDHWVYTFDGARSRMESLCIQGPEVRSNTPYVPGVLISLQPIGWERRTPLDPDFRLAHLDVNLTASQKTFATLTVTETIQIVRPKLQDFSFKLADLHPGQGALGGGLLRKTALIRVVDEEGQELNFDHRAGYLLVHTRRAFTNGQTLKLRFEIEGDFLGGDQASFNLWRLGPSEGWYPEPDISGQGFTVTSRVAVEKPFVPIASAKTVRRYATDTHNVLESSLDKATIWFSLAAGRYEPREMTKNGITVRAWGYSGIGHGADPLLKTTHGVLEFYKSLFGNVPFDEINLVEYPSIGFGQAPAGMIWLTREAFDAIGDDVNRYVAGKGAVGGWVNRLVSHELAHQYWGHQVKMFGSEDQWLTESFAEYTSSLAMKAMKNKGPEVYNIIVRDWEERAKKAAPVCPIPFANYLEPSNPEHSQYRRYLVYEKGAYLLANLHHELGDKSFFALFRAYQQNYAWYPPSYNQDVPTLLKMVTGKDYQKWFDDYFWGTQIPSWRP